MMCGNYLYFGKTLGWNIAGLHRQPNAAANHSCIALSKAFLGSGETIQEVDYYFWMSLPCTRNLQFVCKKAVQNSGRYISFVK